MPTPTPETPAPIMTEPPPGSILYVLEDGNNTFLGYCQPTSERDPSPRVEANGFIGIMLPARAVQGIQSSVQGPQKVFNVMPISILDWVEVVFVRPTRYYLAGPQTVRVHHDAYIAFIKEHERARAEQAGVVLATSDMLAEVAGMMAKTGRPH